MSRETIKDTLIETFKKLKQRFVKDVECESFKELDPEDQDYVFHNIANASDVIEFLGKRDSFQDYFEKSEASTVWQVSDNKIEIIEDDPVGFAGNVLEWMYESRLANAAKAMEPKVISYDHISIFQDILNDKKHEKGTKLG